MEDNQFIIIKNNQYFKIEPLLIKYDKKSKRVKSSDNSKTRRFIKAYYLSKENEEKNILFEISDVKIHKLTPLNEEEGYIDIVLNNDIENNKEVFRFFAKFDQYNVEEANKNKESWFNNDELNINYLEEIYKPCLKIDSKGRIILRSAVYLRDFSPDFEIIDENDEYIEFKDIIDKNVEIIFENKGLIFSSKSFTPLFFINTIKLLNEKNNEDLEDEILFSRQSIKSKEKFYFNDEISLEKNIKNENKNLEKNEDLSVDSELAEFLDSLENKKNWLKEIKNQEKVNKELKDDFNQISSKTLAKKKRDSKKIKIIKKKSEKQILN